MLEEIDWEKIDQIFSKFDPSNSNQTPYFSGRNEGGPVRNSFYYIFEKPRYTSIVKGWNYDNPCFGRFLKRTTGLEAHKMSVFGTNAKKFPRNEFTDAFVNEFLTSSVCAPWVHCPSVDYWFEKGFVVDHEAPYGVVVAATHAARYVTEHPEVFDHYKTLLDMGFKSKYAYVLSLMYQCTYAMSNHSRWGANGCTYPYIMSNVKLEDILEQKMADHFHKPFNKTQEPYSNSVERLFPRHENVPTLYVYNKSIKSVKEFVDYIFTFTKADKKDYT